MRSAFAFVCLFLFLYGSECHKLIFKHLPKDVPVTDHWALLVAGSNEWENYRHQADVAHAYQILRARGFPANRIITMMYDDIAFNKANPFPGQIFNAIGGKNLYEGLVIDYKGEDVNPSNFLAILRGDEKEMAGKGSGKVIKSGPNDHVFVNFVDHGAKRILGFPDGYLHEHDLMETIKAMSNEKKFGQMTLYIEACYAGSMFLNLPSNINVYALTAANEDESSYACILDEKLQAYLGDVFSVNWMADTEKEGADKETLETQYENVKKLTKKSHVSRYGDLKIAKETIDNFQGETPKEKNINGKPQSISGKTFADAVPSEDVAMALLHRRLSSAKDHKEAMKIMEEIEDLENENAIIELTVSSIIDRIMENDKNSNNDELIMTDRNHKPAECSRQISSIFIDHCFNVFKNGHAKRQLNILLDMCERNMPTEKIADALLEECLGN